MQGVAPCQKDGVGWCQRGMLIGGGGVNDIRTGSRNSSRMPKSASYPKRQGIGTCPIATFSVPKLFPHGTVDSHVSECESKTVVCGGHAIQHTKGRHRSASPRSSSPRHSAFWVVDRHM